MHGEKERGGKTVNRTVSNEEIKKYYIYTEIRFMEDFDYKAMEALAPEQLKSGKPLFGKGGAFAPLLEKILNAAPEGEMDAHMDCEERSLGNRRNVYTSKQVQPGMGEVGIHTPRDRDSRFEPEFIKKSERVLADSVSDHIIGLYALSNSSHARYAALKKLVYPAYRNIGKNWTTPLSNWGANRSTIGYYISGQI